MNTDQRHAARTTLIQITPLPQIVPSQACFRCEVCCRFPDADSALRPYFTPEEIRRATAAGLDPACFPHPEGGHIELARNPAGEGFICPAFDPTTQRCGIYEARPLDCQIYPLAMMWSRDGTQVVLGWDTKCPFLREGRGEGPAAGGEEDEATPDLEAYAARIAERVEGEESVAALVEHPGLVGAFQDDVIILRSLPRLTARLTPARQAGEPSRAGRETLHPLTMDDRALVEAALGSATMMAPTELAAFAFAPHLIWRSCFGLWRAEIERHLCLFADYADGLFMLLPPLGPGPLGPPLERAFALMDARNRGTAVSRVENVPEEASHAFEACGYRLKPKDPDYLYDSADLATLAGDRYKSQRAACNRLYRTGGLRYEPYREADGDACLSLFDKWAGQKRAAGLDGVAEHMLRDARAAHREAFTQRERLGLTGRVLRVDGDLVAYTFGFPRSPSTFCVLLEVADRAVPGAAPALFREVAREAVQDGYRYVNAMDASGLRTLAASKDHYHPIRLVPNLIASRT